MNAEHRIRTDTGDRKIEKNPKFSKKIGIKIRQKKNYRKDEE